jgi:hypothetical protein
MLVQNGIFAALLVAAAFLIVWLMRDNHVQWDLTQNQRNTLSKATLDLLKKIDGPIKVTAYSTTQDAQLGDIRRLIREFIDPYQRAKPNVTLTFVDPREYPKETQAANVRSNGELVVEYGKRSEHLTSLNEQSMTNLLQRVARSQERVIAYLDGHGEPRLDGRGNFDLGDFGRQLGNKGFHSQPLNLAVVQDVPDNVNVLLIATPRAELLGRRTFKGLSRSRVNLLANRSGITTRPATPGQDSPPQLTPGVAVILPPSNCSIRRSSRWRLLRRPSLPRTSPTTPPSLVRQIATKEENGARKHTTLGAGTARLDRER